METLVKRAFPQWSQYPIPNFTLSAAGLVVLADLSTIAQRTAITGGSSWLDALLLAPGLHYQQAVDGLADGSGQSVRGGASGSNGESGPRRYNAVEMLQGGKQSSYDIANTATIRYLQRLAAAGPAAQRIIVDVGAVPQRGYFASRNSRRRHRPSSGPHAAIWPSDSDIGWLSNVLYLASPVLTVATIVMMALLREWWGIALLLTLIAARIMNIVVIKSRARQPSDDRHLHHRHHHRHSTSPDPEKDNPGSGDRGRASSLSSATTTATATATTQPVAAADLLTEYVVDLGGGRVVCLRGLSSDLQAITSRPWLAAKTHVDGYLEAASKLAVYLVAALAGNMTQAGSLVLVALLVTTAALLGLSNAHARTLRMHGRVAAPTRVHLPLFPSPGSSGDPGLAFGGGGSSHRAARRRHRHSSSSSFYTPPSRTPTLTASQESPSQTLYPSQDSGGGSSYYYRHHSHHLHHHGDTPDAASNPTWPAAPTPAATAGSPTHPDSGPASFYLYGGAFDDDDEKVAASSFRSGRTAVTMALDDFAEKGQIGEAARARPPRTRGGARGSRHGSATYPFDAEVDFK